ncbi:MAG: DUF1016 N-terminal domain-containing protein [Candidatus Omnitrophota bacterium]
MSSKTTTIQASNYRSLLKQVEKTLLEGQARIEQERVRTYWETGRIIHTHILKNKDRADYGVEVIARLARDLGVDKTLLNRCFKFARTYASPPIGAPGHQFTWSHYRQLMAIPDDKERLLIEEKAGRNGWSSKELQARVKIRPSGEGALVRSEEPAHYGRPNAPLTPSRGTLYTYRFVSRPALGDNPEARALLLDQGFGVFRDIDPRVSARFADEAIVESRPKNGDYTFSAGERTAKDLFTYRAYIEKVVDGDTLKVRVDLGFLSWHREVLRLRDIDCPEAGTKEGDAAKTFVRSLLKEASLIILRSSKADKYDRYLADVFIPQGKEPDPATDVYLNNLLLEKGYASRV